MRNAVGDPLFKASSGWMNPATVMEFVDMIITTQVGEPVLGQLTLESPTV
jgi:hypothetical protein